MNIKYFSILAIAGIILAGSAIMSPVEAATTTNAQKQQKSQQSGNMQQSQNMGTVGTVTAVNGTTITMTSKQPAKDTSAEATATYTVDASNATVTKNNGTSSVSAITTGETIIVEGTISGTNITATSIKIGMSQMNQEREGQQIDKNTTIGTVTVVSGTTITMTSKQSSKDSTTATETTTTYTVDAGSAKVTEDGKDSTVSAIVVGDRLMVKGTTSGTTITATSIAIQNNQGQSNTADSGEPVVVGTVTAVNGTTITMTNKNEVVYTVETSAANITKNNSETTVSGISVGDTIVVQGTFSGTTVTATTVVDQGAPSSTVNTVKKANIFNTIVNAFKKFFRF